MRFAKGGMLSSVNAIVVRIDPRVLRLRLDSGSADYGLRATWTVERMPDDAVAAFNAGQFIGGLPWGWLVVNGVERKPPGTGRLTMSFVLDRDGRAQLVTPAELAAARTRTQFAFQSYPMLLAGDGEMPWELRGPGRGVDLGHRDSRLAIGITRGGEIIVVLTRFAIAGNVTGSLPFGPTVPEMALFMRGLGADRAMMLDGGISSQLAVRGADGVTTRWANWRPVPLAVIATRRAP
jgi:exopolysaccharide biosynthesis protein